MTEDEVKEIVAGAVETTEKNPDKVLPVKRAQMANWLWSKFKISINELVVSIEDGLPYLKVSYINEANEEAETTVSMAKYQEKLTVELEKMAEKIVEK